MTMGEFREEYGSVVAVDSTQLTSLSDPRSLQVLSNEVIESIINDDQISEIGRRVIQNLVNDQDGRLRVVLNLAAVQEIQNLQTLYNSMSSIQATLLDERQLAKMNSNSLVKVYQSVEKSIHRILEFLKSLSTNKDKNVGNMFETNVVNIFQNDPDAPEVPKSVASRERVKALFQSMLQSAGSSVAGLPGGETIREIEATPINKDSVDEAEKDDNN